MSETFRKLETVRPLRLTVADVGHLGGELMRQAASGGEVTIEYRTDYEDGAKAESKTTQEFLDKALGAEEDPRGISITVHGWTATRDIDRSYSVRFAHSGTQFQVGSDDVNWGRGAVQSLQHWFKRRSPRYIVVLHAAMYGCAFLPFIPLVLFGIVARHEDGRTGVYWIALALSAVVFVATVWLIVQWVRGRAVPHTRIVREKHNYRALSIVKVVAAVVAFVADVVVIIVAFAR